MTEWRERPADVRPMLASLEAPPIAKSGLIYEPKYDGIRALADIRPPASKGAEPYVALYSRNGREKHAQFPAIVAALGSLARRLPAPVLVDGEIVAIDGKGRPLGFQHIQGRIHLTASRDIEQADRDQPAALVLFDLLRDGREDLRAEPLVARRLRLQQRIKPVRSEREMVRLSEIVADDGRALMARAEKEGWEGLIAKDAQSVYRSGQRTPAWRKMKILLEQEFVIGGWTEPRQTRQHFGALLLGWYDERQALRWAGSVGTGFTQSELDRIAALLKKQATAKSPFADRVATPETPHWVKPVLVAQVRFTEWTSDGLLRQPVYLGLRDDKKAKDVTRERAGLAARGQKRSGLAVQDPISLSATVQDPVSLTSDAALLARLTEIEKSRKDAHLKLPGGQTLHVTNLHKVFWPASGLTKGDLMRHYVRVAPFLLPIIDDRPLVMKRFPNGVGKIAFYQQRHPEEPPAGVRRAVLPADVEPITEDGPRDRLIGGSLITLLYMTQLAAISQDPWFSRVSAPFHPDHVAIDLDPGDDAPFSQVIDVARWVKEELDRHGIPGFPKTSGASGLHIYIPLPKRTTYETGQLLCQMIATLVATKHPRAATVERMVKKRPPRTVYVDYLQNILGKTIATAYSARASDYAGVSTPLAWKEVKPGLDPKAFTIQTIAARLERTGDLWRGLRESKPVDIAALVRRAAGTEPRTRARRPPRPRR
jgi:bifunctional non-homologous end joining protein LigD